MSTRALLVALCTLALCACRTPEEVARSYLTGVTEVRPGLFVTEEGRELSTEALSARASRATYLLVGERHDQRCDHEAQAAVLRALQAAGVRPVVALEMVGDAQQRTLDAFVGRPTTLPEFEAAVPWAKEWGVPLQLYAPVLEPALQAGLPLVALSLSGDLEQRAVASGWEALPPEERARLPERVLPSPEEQLAFLEEVFEGHADQLPAEVDRGEALRRFLAVQALWDTQFATVAARAARERGAKVLVLVGAAHVENGWGIASRLALLEPGADVLTVVPWDGSGPLVRGEAELFFYCR